MADEEQAEQRTNAKELRALAPKLKALVPGRLKRHFRGMHREFVFRRAMHKFMERPEAFTSPKNRVVNDLVYGWGNENWSALNDYLCACVKEAIKTQGAILECGSGLTTILIGAIAHRRGIQHLALEHEPLWANRVQHALSKYKIRSVELRVAPLMDFGEFCWYDASPSAVPASISLVICDGPPHSTKGGRAGLVPLMKGRLRSDCVILLDDADRPAEQEIAKRWASELGGTLEIINSHKSYARVVGSDG